MGKIKNSGFFRIISSILVITFISLDIACASEVNSYKLAAPSSFSDFKGPEFKEAAQIQIGIRMAMKGLGSLDVASLRALGRLQFTERTVFAKKISGTMHFNEAQTYELSGQGIHIESNGYLVKAQTAGGTIYYCLISKKNRGKGYDISIVPERVITEELQKGTVRFTHGSINQKDKAIIDLYIEHEVSTKDNAAIDEWIRERMERGEYMADASVPELNALYKNAQEAIPGYVHSVLDTIYPYLARAGVENENIKKIKRVLGGASQLGVAQILIPYDWGSLPSIMVGTQKISVTAHSSAFATYIFLPRVVYDRIRKKEDARSGIYNLIEKELIHEIGARCGLKVTVKDGRTWNLLDEAVEELKAGREVVPSRELQDMAPVNLLELELRSDYAAGNMKEARNAFGRAVSLALLGVAPALSSGNAAGAPIDNTAVSARPGNTTPVNSRELEEIKIKKATDRIQELIDEDTSRDWIVGTAVLNEILKMDTKDAIAVMRGLEYRRLYALINSLNISVGMKGEPALFDSIISMLLECFRSDNAGLRWSGFNTLMLFKDVPRVGEAINPVMDDKVLRNIYELGASPWGWGNVGNCKNAAYRLGELRDKRAINPLIAKIYNTGDSAVAGACLRALSNIDDPKAFGVIWKIKDDQWPGFSSEYYAELLSKFSCSDKAVQFIFKNGKIDSVLWIYDKLDETQKASALQLAKAQLSKDNLEYSCNILKAMVEKLGMTEYKESYKIHEAFLDVGDEGNREILRALDKTKFLEFFGKFYINAPMSLSWRECPNLNSLVRIIKERGMGADVIPLLNGFLSRKTTYQGLKAGDRRSDMEYCLTIANLAVDLGESEYKETALIYQAVASGDIDGLVKRGQNVVPVLIEAIYENNSSVPADRAAKALGKIGSPSKDALPRLKELAISTRHSESVCNAAKEAVISIEKALGNEGASKPGVRDTVKPEAGEAPKKAEEKTPQSETKDAVEPGARLRSSERPREAAAKIGAVIPYIDNMRFGDMWRAEKITDVLWKASTGAIPAEAAKSELASLAPEVGRTTLGREAVYDIWLDRASILVAALTTPRVAKYTQPSDDDVRRVAARIKNAGVEAFVQKSQFPGDTISKYRNIIEGLGGKLKVYQDIKDLRTMIKNPEKSIVMLNEVISADSVLPQAPGLRFINFAKRDDLDKMTVSELDNYEAEMFSILLIARIITPEDLADKSNPVYRMLSHLLENYMPDGISVENYIQDIVTNAVRLIKTILKALPIAVYEAMRQSVAVLWSA